MVTPLTEVTASVEGREIYKNVFPPGEYVIGRDEDAQIYLESPKVSRKHAQLTLNYFDWLIEDFGSANGTFVGGKQITDATFVFPQQDVIVGNVKLEFRRLQVSNASDSLAPQTAAVMRYLPTEMRGARKYKIHGIIATGGMGAVLEAEDLATRRRVAMKLVLDAKSEEDVARFVEEAQITAQLEHPNIVPVYDLNVNELDRPFYTMRLVRGDSLAVVLSGLRMKRQSTLERYGLSELITIFQRVCDAISYAHSKGVVHRDLKPDNILLGAFGETMVMDWGLAKPLGHRADANMDFKSVRTMVSSARQEDGALGTVAGLALGSPQYMAPEQACGKSHTVDARADVYALGAILYSLLTLQPPVEGATPQDSLVRVATGKITPSAEAIRRHPPAHLPGGKLPQEVVKIAMKALSLDPADRYSSVGDMQTALREVEIRGRARG